MTEPATFFSDMLLAGFSVYFAARLWKKNRGASASRCTRWWAISFVVLGLSAFFGGVYHGSGTWFPQPVRDIVWRLTLVCMAIMSACMVISISYSTLQERHQKILQTFAVLKGIAIFCWVCADPRFVVGIIDYGTTMLLMTGLAWANLMGGWQRPGRWILSAVVVSVVGALVQFTKLAPHPHFNHNDLFHMIQLVGNWLFFRAALVSKDWRVEHRTS